MPDSNETFHIPHSIFHMLRWSADGLIPAIVQDEADGTVLMMAWMNEESLRLTLERGEAIFWSRSRQEIWHKGATSGNVMQVRELRYDCDGDTLLLRVTPAGPACHTGERSCFFRRFD
jgi:phosphoribosyl-AMP cyclohydrolase